MKIFFIHGSRGKKFDVLLDSNRHEVVPIDFTSTSNFARVWRVLSAVRAHGRSDLVIADDHGLFAFWAYLASRLLGCPYFVRLRGDNWDEEEHRLAEKAGIAAFIFAASRWLYFTLGNFALRRARSIIPVSHYLKGVVTSRLGVPDQRIAVIHVPVLLTEPIGPISLTKAEARKELALPAGPLALMVTNFRFPRKIAAIFHFWPQLEELFQRTPDLTLLIAGDGPHLALAAKHVSPWVATRQVVFLNHQDNIPALMRAADIFMHLSFQDAFPNVVVEAQSSGLPTIVNNSCGMPEQVKHGVTGFVVDNEDPLGLTNISFTLLSDPDLAASLSTAGRFYVKEKFSLEAARQILNKLIAELE
jgi:glycosyltransferase involved in cell wall biosynthesis